MEARTRDDQDGLLNGLVPATSLLPRVASAAQRGQTQSVYRGGFLIGGIVGAAFGGAVLGVSLRAPFFLYAGTLLLAAIVATTMLPKPPPRGDGSPPVILGPEDDGAPLTVVPEQPRTPMSTILRNPAYQAALAGNFAVGFSLLGVLSTVVPLLVVQQLDLAPGWIGAAFAVGALVQILLLLPAGKAVDQIGRRPTLVLHRAAVANSWRGPGSRRRSVGSSTVRNSAGSEALRERRSARRLGLRSARKFDPSPAGATGGRSGRPTARTWRTVVRTPNLYVFSRSHVDIRQSGQPVAPRRGWPPPWRRR